MKKRILALLMASVLTLQLAGCNTKDAGTAGKETQSSIKDQFNSAREERENAGRPPLNRTRRHRSPMPAGRTRMTRTLRYATRMIIMSLSIRIFSQRSSLPRQTRTGTGSAS